MDTIRTSMYNTGSVVRPVKIGAGMNEISVEIIIQNLVFILRTIKHLSKTTWLIKIPNYPDNIAL